MVELISHCNKTQFCNKKIPFTVISYFFDFAITKRATFFVQGTLIFGFVGKYSKYLESLSEIFPESHVSERHASQTK